MHRLVPALIIAFSAFGSGCVGRSRLRTGGGGGVSFNGEGSLAIIRNWKRLALSQLKSVSIVLQK